jgi:hypothetical protein
VRNPTSAQARIAEAIIVAIPSPLVAPPQRYQQRTHRTTCGDLHDNTVIASEAKQSSFASARKLDCFVAIAPRNDG